MSMVRYLAASVSVNQLDDKIPDGHQPQTESTTWVFTLGFQSWTAHLSLDFLDHPSLFSCLFQKRLLPTSLPVRQQDAFDSNSSVYRTSSWAYWMLQLTTGGLQHASPWPTSMWFTSKPTSPCQHPPSFDPPAFAHMATAARRCSAGTPRSCFAESGVIFILISTVNMLLSINTCMAVVTSCKGPIKNPLQ